MRLAIMQPYLFPYLGYFQLIRATDAFVIYDDVNYIKGGWVNRNNILMQGRTHLVTLKLNNASSNKLINEIGIVEKRQKLLKTIQQCYSKAPHFNAVFPLIEHILMHSETNLARFLEHQLRKICDYLGLYPEWHVSSSLKKNNALRGQEKVLAICRELGASQYVNLPGGQLLYDPNAFSRLGIRLSFIQPKPVVYRQFGSTFVSNLSIIDVMMFNDKGQCAGLLGEHELV